MWKFIITIFFFGFLNASWAKSVEPSPSKTDRIKESKFIDSLLASVNGDPILKSDITAFRASLPLRFQLDPFLKLFLNSTDLAHLSNEKILEYLIEENLVVQAFPSTETQVDFELDKMRKSTGLSLENFKLALKRDGISNINSLRNLLKTSASKQQFFHREIRGKIAVSEQSVELQSKKHLGSKSNRFNYELHLIEFIGSIEEAIQLRKQIEDGQISFEQAAKNYSKNQSAQEGGKLGVLSDDMIHPLFQEAVSKTPPGGVTSWIMDPKTKHLYCLKVDSKKPVPLQLAPESQKIRSELFEKAAQDQIRFWLEQKKREAAIKKHV